MSMDKKVSPFIVFRYPDYAYMWWGIFISQIGVEMMIVALNWQVYLLTKSPLSLGLIGAARFIPMLACSLVAGLVADIVNRKKLIFVVQIILIVVALTLAALTFTHTIQPIMIYILVAIYASAHAFGMPARQSIVPHLVPREHFMRAVSLNSLIWQAASIIGPTIGGFIIGLWGVGFIYIFATFSFFAVNIAMFLIKQIPKNDHPTEFSFKSVRTGISFVRHTPLIWSTMFLDFFATFFASSMTLMPIFAKDILKVGPQGLGILYAAPALGSVIFGLLFSSFHNVYNQGKILLVSVIIYGASTALFGMSNIFIFSLLCLFVAGAADSVSSIIRNTVRQLTTPDHLRGRMVSINMIFYMGGPQLGEVEAGIAATLMGTPWSVVFGGVGTIIAALFMAKIVPSLVRYSHHEEVAER